MNHYSAWKYVVLIVTLCVMALSAIPTWYGENAAIQIGAKAGLSASPLSLQRALTDQGISTKRIDQSGNKTIVVLNDESQQAHAKSVLSTMVKDSSQIALALEPAAPMWLQSMGFAPIKLGLDLRGGVQFLLDVDIDQVFSAQTEQLSDELRLHLRIFIH